MLRLDNRENARMVEMCYKTHTTLINPIIDWTTAEVWEFIHEYDIPYCCLYDEGFTRLGCIGCPMGSPAQRMKEFERYPKYKNLYLIAFQKMIENQSGGGTAKTEQVHRPSTNMGMVDVRKLTEDRTLIGKLTQETCSTDGCRTRWCDMTPEEVMNWWIR